VIPDPPAAPSFHVGRAGDLVRLVLQQWHTFTEIDIAKAEELCRRHFPNADEQHLLYALRISHCVPTLRQLKPLASRWNRATGRSLDKIIKGADDAQGCDQYPFVIDKLEQLYLHHYHLICESLVAAAIEKAAKRKSIDAQVSVLETCGDGIDDETNKMIGLPPAIFEAKMRYCSRLTEVVKQVERDARQKSKRH
jgi:hypothetical protein